MYKREKWLNEEKQEEGRRLSAVVLLKVCTWTEMSLDALINDKADLQWEIIEGCNHHMGKITIWVHLVHLI